MPAEDLLLPPVVVLRIEFPELPAEVAQGTEFLERDELVVEHFVISLNLASAARVVRPAEDELDAVLLCFLLEQLRDELLTIVQVDLLRHPAVPQGPAEAVDCLHRTFVQVRFGAYPVARAVIGEARDIDFSDATDAKLEGVSLPHAVHMMPLEPFAGLWLRLDFDEQAMAPEGVVHGLPVHREIELMLETPCAPVRILPLQ